MIFWDTSAIVPLVVDEVETARMASLLRRDAHLVVFWGTLVEAGSAIARRERDGTFSARDADRARKALRTLSRAWTEVLPGDELRENALRLLARHPLRAADALQLSAALTWARGRPTGHAFATLDARMATAARGEGFDLPCGPRRT